MSDPVSDSSAVDRLREQLIEALTQIVDPSISPAAMWRESAKHANHFYDGTCPLCRKDIPAIIHALLPIVAAFGDAREAAGREQGRQDAAEAILEAAVTTDTPMIGRAWLGEAARLARGSGVSVQPTPEEQP
jgi:hypothetical protein